MDNSDIVEKMTEVNFPKLSHFWMDSGIIGLYKLAKVAKEENLSENKVEILLTDGCLTFRGFESNLITLFNKTYWSLLNQYYNKSTEKQIQENSGFYYASNEDKFVRFPKVKSMGIAGLIFNKAPRKTAEQIKYETKVNGNNTKMKILPESYSHLQGRLESFLSETGLKISANNMLIDGPNAIQPKVKIKVQKGKEKGKCFICGESSHTLTEIGGTVYPMITGSSGVLSFNSNGGKPEKACWKCDFIGKFVPVNGFYVYNNESYHIYLPYSSSLIKMSEVYDDLQAAKIDDPNLLRNFGTQLGGFFQRPFEQLFTFLYSLYRVVLSKKNGDENSVLDFEKMFDVFVSRAPLEFYAMNSASLGDTQMGKMIWPFNESVYIFRLFDKIEQNNIEMKKVMSNLVDYEQNKNENKTILRNKVCERILEKRSIVGLVERHVFRINKSKKQFIKPIYDFTILYENTIRESDYEMDQSIIDTAVSLGKTIGISVSSAGSKGKGDLFRLRKSRKSEDFLNEVNRIQMKYGTKVTTNLYAKGQEFEENFAEFKQFCMIAALNTFNASNNN